MIRALETQIRYCDRTWVRAVGERDVYLDLESPRPQQRSVDRVRSVRRAEHHDAAPPVRAARAKRAFLFQWLHLRRDAARDGPATPSMQLRKVDRTRLSTLFPPLPSSAERSHTSASSSSKKRMAGAAACPPHDRSESLFGSESHLGSFQVSDLGTIESSNDSHRST